MQFMTALILFFLTAVMEILGCYLPYVVLKKNGSYWLLIPASICLMLFVWLLTLHPTASGRIYAAYGGAYVVTALIWLRIIDGVHLTITDYLGAGVTLLGTTIIIFGWKSA